MLEAASLVHNEYVRQGNSDSLEIVRQSGLNINIIYLVGCHVRGLVAIACKERVPVIEILQSVQALDLEYFRLSVDNFSLEGPQGRLWVEKERAGGKSETALTE